MLMSIYENKPAILHDSVVSREEFESLKQKFEQKFESLEQEHQAFKQEIESLKEENHHLKQENNTLKQKIQQVEQVCTSNAELLSKALFRVYQLELFQACFCRNCSLVDRNSCIYDAFSREELQHHESKIKMKEFYNPRPIKKEIKGSKSSRTAYYLKQEILENKQKSSYKMQELLGKYQMDVKTMKKVIRYLIQEFPHCISYQSIDTKNKGIVITNRELFEQSLRHWV